MGGTHWACFYVKVKKPIYLYSFCGPSDDILLKQLSKPITFHNCEIQDRNSRFFGKFCFYYFYLKKIMDFDDATLKN